MVTGSEFRVSGFESISEEFDRKLC